MIELFETCPDSIWPGYNLAREPFIFYVPEQWALLVNYPTEVPGFNPYPQDWPKITGNAQIYFGQYKHLAGQLAFMVEVDTIRVAAVPYWERSAQETYAFIIHECFHQFQYDNGWKIPWEREEKYHIQDSVNTSLATLELLVLEDALQMAIEDDKEKCREYIGRFVAVRKARWSRADEYLRKYERGKELQEGTAHYIENRSIACIKDLDAEAKFEDSSKYLDLPHLLLKRCQARLTDYAFSPEDMPRNRIYPVGAVQCYLLDYLGVDWKDRRPDFGESSSYAELFQEELNLDESGFAVLLEKSKAHYNYSRILNSASTQINEYRLGYENELKDFENSDGYRIEISLNNNGVSRSRSSSSKKWLMDNGSRELRSHFKIYSLKKDGLVFQAHDCGLMEENDWDTKRKTVVFYSKAPDSIRLNNKVIALDKLTDRSFANIEMHGQNFDFVYDLSGTISFAGNHISIDIYSK
ncbi:MAG: hypothetical protein GF310_02210 [candidate division Zixibacteria bacterium]|nr:hypothetical protein [candidate division Zixibacteria bacterium]